MLIFSPCPEQDAGGIPSQFPVQEDTQFCQILRESLDFFGIEESRHKEFFLVDHKTRKLLIIYYLAKYEERKTNKMQQLDVYY